MVTNSTSAGTATAAYAGQESSVISQAGGVSVTKDAFMKLLVAQLKHQNPLNPADGAQFLSQLAQFTELEQTMSIRQDVEALRDAITRQAAGVDAGNAGQNEN